MYTVVTSVCREGWQLYFVWPNYSLVHVVILFWIPQAEYPSLVACEASAAASSIWRHSSLFDMEGSRRSSLLDLFCCLPLSFGLLHPKKTNRRIVVIDNLLKIICSGVHIVNLCRHVQETKSVHTLKGAPKPIESVPALCQCKKSFYLQ